MCAVRLVIAKSVQNALIGQRRPEDVEDRVTGDEQRDSSWSSETWPGEWPGVCTTWRPPRDGQHLAVGQLALDGERLEVPPGPESRSRSRPSRKLWSRGGEEPLVAYAASSWWIVKPRPVSRGHVRRAARVVGVGVGRAAGG